MQLIFAQYSSTVLLRMRTFVLHKSIQNVCVRTTFCRFSVFDEVKVEVLAWLGLAWLGSYQKEKLFPFTPNNGRLSKYKLEIVVVQQTIQMIQYFDRSSLNMNGKASRPIMDGWSMMAKNMKYRSFKLVFEVSATVIDNCRPMIDLDEHLKKILVTVLRKS